MRACRRARTEVARVLRAEKVLRALNQSGERGALRLSTGKQMLMVEPADVMQRRQTTSLGFSVAFELQSNPARSAPSPPA